MNRNVRVMTSSKSQVWRTPREWFKREMGHLRLDLDACAAPGSQVCRDYVSQDGLNTSWAGRRVWMNSPYSREIVDWVARGIDQMLSGCPLSVCLVPARVGASWWRRHVLHLGEPRLLERVGITFDETSNTTWHLFRIGQKAFTIAIHFPPQRLVFDPEPVSSSAVGNPAPFDSAVLLYAPILPRAHIARRRWTAQVPTYRQILEAVTGKHVTRGLTRVSR